MQENLHSYIVLNLHFYIDFCSYEMLADDFYKYCSNEMGWENIKNWRALAKGYINNPYDLTKSKKPNKPKTTQKKHKTNRKVTQEDKEELKALMNSLHEGPI